MNVISSEITLFYKKVFPAISLGFIAFIVITVIASGAMQKDPMFLIGPVFMAAILIVVFKRVVWDLADEVLDGGDFLIVRRGGVEERVQLTDILNVSMNQFINPPRLSLRLRKPGKFGDEIVFSPPWALMWKPLLRNEIAEDLIQRVDRARLEDSRR